MSACIIPVAPNFQDPPSISDSGPFLSSFSPGAFGELVTVPVPQGTQFSANVTDLNVKATLSIRWVMDYPPASDATHLVEQSPITPRADGLPQPITTPPPGQPGVVNCDWVIQRLTSTHQLELIVADSEFADSSTAGLPPDRKFDTPKDPNGHVVHALWPIDISCPASTTSNTSSP